MTCEEILQRFPESLEGTLGEEDRLETEEHLARCPDCAAAWRGMQGAVGEAGRALAGEPEPPEGARPDYWDRFLPRLRTRLGARRPPARAGRPAWALPAAAALVLGFSLGALAGGVFGRLGDGTTAYVDRLPAVDPFTSALEEVLEEDWDLQESLDGLTEEERLLLLDELARELT